MPALTGKLGHRVWVLLKTAVLGWLDDRAPSMGAAIAFDTLFSLAPVLLLVIAVAGIAFGEEAARGAIVAQLGGLMGQEGAATLQAMIATAGASRSDIIATVIGVVTLLIGATTVFAELQSSLNVIWKAEPPKEPTLVWMVRVRLASLSLIVVMGFLLLVSLVVSAALSALGGFLSGILPGLNILLNFLNTVLSFAVIAALIATIFRVLPDVVIPWSDVWLGAVVTALLFTIGKTVIGLYIGSSQVATTYGAAGALVIILLWVYYTAQIFLFGAEITKAQAALRGSRKEAAAELRAKAKEQVLTDADEEAGSRA
jgi:membrane protein